MKSKNNVVNLVLRSTILKALQFIYQNEDRTINEIGYYIENLDKPIYI